MARRRTSAASNRHRFHIRETRRQRRFSNRDSNHEQIVNTFLDMGWSVVELSARGVGVPDILVGGKMLGGDRFGERVMFLVEIKTEVGELEETQKRFIDELWQGTPVAVIRTVSEAAKLMGMS